MYVRQSLADLFDGRHSYINIMHIVHLTSNISSSSVLNGMKFSINEFLEMPVEYLLNVY